MSSEDPGLNPNIRSLVAWCQKNGFETTDSGDGKTHDHACDRDYPYVSMRVEADGDLSALVTEADRLADLVQTTFGVSLAPIGEPGPCILASYDPSNGIGIIDLMGIDDDLMPSHLRIFR